MASLISDTNKADLQSTIMDVWDTFKRPIIIYKEPEKVIISTNPNYSRFGDNSQNQYNPPVTPQPITVYATILHEKRQRLTYIDAANSQIKVKNDEGQVRIKVDSTGYNVMVGAKNIELDGFQYRVNSSPRPHGLFTPSLWTFFLERAQ